MRGFLPCSNPAGRLVVKKEEYRPLVETVEGLFANLGSFVKNQTVREEVVCQLRNVVRLVDHAWTETLDSFLMEERGFLIYSSLASAYVNTGNPLNRLSKEITIPLVRFGARCRRFPTLDYNSYILSNWQLTGSSISVNGIAPLFTFSDTDEERLYIVKRVVVEQKSAKLVESDKTLEILREQLTEMNDVLRNSKELPTETLRSLKPFTSVMYEGWGWTEPRQFPSHIATQSPTVSLVSRLLGVPYNDGDFSNHRSLANNDMVNSGTALAVSDSKVYNECLEAFAEMVDMISHPESQAMWDRFGVSKTEFIEKNRKS